MQRLVLCWMLCCCWSACLGAGPAAKRPNVVLVMSDDLGWKDVGYQGSEIATPNIDRLAATGVRLNRYYAFPMCWPTRTAMMTGRMGIRMGLEYRMTGVPADEQLLPQLLRDNSYQTWMVGKWHLGNTRTSQFPHRRGFDHFYGHTAQGIDYFTHVNRGALDWQRNGVTVREQGYSTELLTAEALQLLAARDPARPFFLYVAYNAPHSPWQVPPEYIDAAKDFVDENRRTYAAMIKVMDDGIGQIVSALDDAEIRENTLVIWVSDNGGSRAVADNGELRGGKSTLFEGGIRVPGVVNWPGRIPAGGVINQQIVAYDWLPTLANATGLSFKAAKTLDGQDMWPAIAEGLQVQQGTRVIGHSGGRAVFHDRWKLVHAPPGPGMPPTSLLFDLQQDPFEKFDLAAEHPQIVKRLEAAMIPPTATADAGGRSPGGRNAGGAIARLDKDQDGQLSKEEVAGARLADRFDELDLDQDGFLTAEETAVLPRRGRGGRRGRPAASNRGVGTDAGGQSNTETQPPVAEAAIRD